MREPTDLASLAASMRHTTPSGVAQAVRGIAPWNDAPTLVRDVMKYVGAHLRVARTRGIKVAILVGEVHTLQSCLMVELAAMQAVHRDHGANAAFMLQHTPDAVHGFARGGVARLHETMAASAGEAADAFERRLGASLCRGADRQRAACHAAVKLHAAALLGFSVTGFDTQRDAPLQRVREAAMVRAVAAQLAAGDGPVIVAVARRHLAVLRDGLAKDSHVVALAAADPSICCETQSGADLARNSYAVSHPSVRPFRASSRLEHEPLRYLRFAAQLAGDARGPGLRTHSQA